MLMNYRVAQRILLRCSIPILLTFNLLYFTCSNQQVSTQQNNNYRRRNECKCYRTDLPPLYFSRWYLENPASSLCSVYATRRGPHQRIISISLFGPRENKIFHYNQSIAFLHQLINDLNTIYPDNYTLRVHHDDTISFSDVICPIECRYSNVDFCDMKSKLFIPPKIWRFIPAGDPLVDIMMSRDLDSALTLRERAAVDAWLSSKKALHVMRDHPLHAVPMLGGTWGFRPTLNARMSRLIHKKIHNQALVSRYGGSDDQTFLSREVWPLAKTSAIVHDSFLCRLDYGQKPDPFPTQRPPPNETNCFVGCLRSSCEAQKMPFPPCPLECRPKNHLDWTYC